MAGNYNFGGYINDDNKYRLADELDVSLPHVTVEALLCLRYGIETGKKIYADLSRLAHKAAEKNGGEPGLIFDDKGGHFVSFHDRDLEQ
jgi:hypothetical protein